MFIFRRYGRALTSQTRDLEDVVLIHVKSLDLEAPGNERDPFNSGRL